ncbi:hypothetical protein AAFF_G00034270 [Aldrovandia affinis]|uniref:Uncharacterized protein n=1 Tax=Aldrovandia affinis TaxID=143900 RepID=A0AAD7S3H9_9TELE|nr:hypothetical protein AAFF_G00034270 [Aldrovandia affinis]
MRPTRPCGFPRPEQPKSEVVARFGSVPAFENATVPSGGTCLHKRPLSSGTRSQRVSCSRTVARSRRYSIATGALVSVAPVPQRLLASPEALASSWADADAPEAAAPPALRPARCLCGKRKLI